MRQAPCLIYRENEHFHLPPNLAAMKPHLNEYVVRDADGRLHPTPELFREVNNPDEAHFFLFPYDIGQYVDACRLDDLAAVVDALPYLPGRAERHIFFDYADQPVCLPQPVCLFKVSLLRPDAGRAVVTWYVLPEHSARSNPSFDWGDIRHDVSFVGKYTHKIRRAAVASIRQQAPELRFFLAVDDSLQVQGRFFSFSRQEPEEVKEKQRIFLKSIRESWTVLCAPGIGPQSIRMYETMLLGRIPIRFGDNIVYPREGEVDFNAFTLNIPMSEVMNTGLLLRDWLAGQSQPERQEKCVLACRTWNRYFAANKLRVLFGLARKLYDW